MSVCGVRDLQIATGHVQGRYPVLPSTALQIKLTKKLRIELSMQIVVKAHGKAKIKHMYIIYIGSISVCVHCAYDNMIQHSWDMHTAQSFFAILRVYNLAGKDRGYCADSVWTQRARTRGPTVPTQPCRCGLRI